MNKKQYKNKLKYTRVYNKENYKGVAIRLSYDKEQDIIEHLNNYSSVKAYLINLIRADMNGDIKRGKKDGKKNQQAKI